MTTRNLKLFQILRLQLIGKYSLKSGKIELLMLEHENFVSSYEKINLMIVEK